MQYEDLIQQFLYEAVPTIPVTEEIKFEAISKEIFGTKQRRNGPMPSPEVQVKIRDILREHSTIRFFLPWGSRKLVSGMGLDILEFCALKQLRTLQETLKSYGRFCSFTFRLENLTDMWLFGEDSSLQITNYVRNFKLLASQMLDIAHTHTESMFTPHKFFIELCQKYQPVFEKYLLDLVGIEALEEIGWKGTIPPAQRKYYEDAYKVFYPNSDANYEMSKYFAATLARVKLEATCAPGLPHIQISFSNPVPCHPLAGNRVHYRTVPERYTHQHRAPWNAKGYFEINEAGQCTPRIAGFNDQLDLHIKDMQIGEARVQCDYLITE